MHSIFETHCSTTMSNQKWHGILNFNVSKIGK